MLQIFVNTILEFILIIEFALNMHIYSNMDEIIFFDCFNSLNDAKLNIILIPLCYFSEYFF